MLGIDRVLDECTDIQLAVVDEWLRAEMVKAETQAAVDQFNLSRSLRERPRVSHDGIGETVMEMTPLMYHRLTQKHNNGDYRCWGLDGGDFKKWVRREHPETRVKSQGTKEIQVGYQAPQLQVVSMPQRDRGSIKETIVYS